LDSSADFPSASLGGHIPPADGLEVELPQDIFDTAFHVPEKEEETCGKVAQVRD
jgi:hypothetical protein